DARRHRDGRRTRSPVGHETVATTRAGCSDRRSLSVDHRVKALTVTRRGALGEEVDATLTSMVSVTLAHRCVTSNCPCQAVAKLRPTIGGVALIEKPLLLAIQNAGASVRPALWNSSTAAL